MSRSRRLRDLSGAPAFEQLTAELARAAMVAKGRKSPRRQTDEKALRPAAAKPDGSGGATSDSS
ncbi:hypothetical protein [Streptomyces fagopyri]|uniref:hypothetical protein n=1 Tax=Streptomyces fagopyri TaxID=2662397 RepID=UPI003403D04D